VLWSRRATGSDQPVARDTVHAVIAGSTASFAAHGYGLWILDDGAGFAGMCGLRAAEHGQVEVLYSIEPDRWHRGLATAAAAAVLQHAFGELELERVVGSVDDANHASRRVLEKLAMTPLDAPADAPPGVGWLVLSRERWRDAARST
jgi:RimJ/RimL family protein N-acetyltransferase